MEYKCNKCGNVSEASKWNENTIEDLKKDGLYSGKFTKIEDVNLDNYELSFFYYNCPECFDNCYVEDGHITRVNE